MPNIRSLSALLNAYKKWIFPIVWFSSPVTHFTSTPKLHTFQSRRLFNFHLISSSFVFGIKSYSTDQLLQTFNFYQPPTTIKMLPQHVLLALVATVAAVPLNINLGAYSPALVVGDGEIAIGEAKSASELMATLSSGANAAGGAAAGGEAARPGQQQREQSQPAEAAETQEQPTEGETAKRAPNLLRRAIGDLISRRAPQEDKLEAVEGAMEWIKRDLQGFNAALSYAREALKDAPKVELGSPNAGIGIVVNPGVNVQKGSAAAGAPARRVKRDELDDEVDDETESPKMTLVAITEV
jgi:hypothetical protein